MAVYSFNLSTSQLLELVLLLCGVATLHLASLPLVPMLHECVAERPQLASHCVVSLVAFLTFASYGSALWFRGPSGADTCGSDRIGGYCTGSAHLALMMLAFQA